MKQTTFLLSFLLFSFHAIVAQQEGFVAGTLVKTPNGYTPIEQLQAGNTVIGYDQQTGYTERKVLNVIQQEASYYVKLSLSNITCSIGTHQKFYLSHHNAWAQARHLKPGDLLSSNNNYVTQVENIQSPISLYALTVELHSFCVTPADILVHNIEPISTGCGIATVMATGAVVNPVGAAVVGGAMAVVGTGAFIYKLWKTWFGKPQQTELIQAEINTSSDNQKENPQMPAACPPQSSGGNSNVPPEDPEKDKDKNKSRRVKIFEKNAKHTFRKKEGHMSDTPANRLLLEDMASDKSNFLGVCERGNEWYSQILPNGKQLWASVREGFIRDGGLNETPHIFNSKTGLSRLLQQ
jgi:hypothetical protein